MMGLTRRQADCLGIVRAYIAEHGCSPSYAELMRALGCRSKSTVGRLLGGLKARGHVDWTRYGQRTLRLVEPPPPVSALRASTPSPACGGGLGRGFGRGHALPPELQARLARFCDAHGDECDNGIDPGWTHCPFCGAQARNEGDEDAEALAVFGAAFDDGAST